MHSTMTSKGQVTIPKRIRDALQLAPGEAVEFDANAAGEIILRRARGATHEVQDRFAAARGRATIDWHSTEELMSLLRPEEE